MKSNVLIAHHKDVAAYNKQKKTKVFKGFKGFKEQNTQEIRTHIYFRILAEIHWKGLRIISLMASREG